MSDAAKSPSGSAPAATARSVYHARIERILDHAEDVRSLFLRSEGRSLPPFIPGMFISVAIPLAAGERVRPYTIASSPEMPEPFEIVFNRVRDGVATAWLYERKVGDEVAFTGPYGLFTLATPPSTELILVAENTAIAPLRPMIRRALASQPTSRIDLVYAADRPGHLLYLPEFEEMAAANPQFSFTTMVVEGGAGRLYPRLADELRRRWIDSDSDRTRHFYLCGVGDGVIGLRDVLRGAGYERRSVHYEKW